MGTSIRFEEVWAAVKAANGRNRSRLLTRAEVEEALALRARSTAKVVRAWGGFVANSYFGKAEATRLDLYADGSFEARRQGCKRAWGKGKTLLESENEGARTTPRATVTRF